MKEGSRNGGISIQGDSMRGTGGRASLLGTLKDMLHKTLEWATVSTGALLLGNTEEHFFLKAFEIKRYIKRYVKMSCKQVSLSIGTPMGNLDGICLPGLFGRKGKYIWVPFFDPEEIKILSLGGHLQLW